MGKRCRSRGRGCQVPLAAPSTARSQAIRCPRGGGVRLRGVRDPRISPRRVRDSGTSPTPHPGHQCHSRPRDNSRCSRPSPWYCRTLGSLSRCEGHRRRLGRCSPHRNRRTQNRRRSLRIVQDLTAPRPNCSESQCLSAARYLSATLTNTESANSALPCSNIFRRFFRENSTLRRVCGRVPRSLCTRYAASGRSVAAAETPAPASAQLRSIRPCAR
jgi:hypothetical protein